jgi:hypothetical protein
VPWRNWVERVSVVCKSVRVNTGRNGAARRRGGSPLVTALMALMTGRMAPTVFRKD